MGEVLSPSVVTEIASFDSEAYNEGMDSDRGADNGGRGSRQAATRRRRVSGPRASGTMTTTKCLDQRIGSDGRGPG